MCHLGFQGYYLLREYVVRQCCDIIFRVQGFAKCQHQSCLAYSLIPLIWWYCQSQQVYISCLQWWLVPSNTYGESPVMPVPTNFDGPLSGNVGAWIGPYFVCMAMIASVGVRVTTTTLVRMCVTSLVVCSHDGKLWKLIGEWRMEKNTQIVECVSHENDYLWSQGIESQH